MKSKPVNISAPTLAEKIILRSMIFIGLISICYFLYALLNPENIGEPILYSLLMVTILYLSLHNIVEWYNYYSISIPPKPTKKIDITVDFFTTFCKGEPYEMITETLLAIKAIRYPHKTFLCDEADDPFLKKFCKEHDIIHVTRTIKIDAKAGNINNALKQSNAELCVVLDPDHVPAPEMLDQLVHYFHDKDMGYVQIVQAYKNMDDSLIAKGAAQQTFQFYGPMMMCMNTYGTAQAIGANCIFRRKALDSIGGHAAGLAEDMHTAMRIQAEGWKTIYVPEILTRGLVPSTLSAYYKQQLKWSKGSFDLLFHVYPKLFKKFTIRQKIHYALLPLHYLAGFIYLLNFLIPVISLFSGIIPLKMDFVDFSIIGLPILLSTFFIRMFVQRWVMEETERGVHTVGGILQIGTWWIFILGFYYSCIGAKVPYTPTPKDGNEANNWPLNVPNIIIALLSIAAIIYGLNYDFNPFSVFMSALAALNVMFMIIVIGMSRQEQIKNLFHKKKTFDSTRTLIRKGKRQFWFFRHFVYSVLRRTGIVVLILSCFLSFYVLNKFNQYKFASKDIEHKENIENESFVFSPVLVNLNQVKEKTKIQKRFDFDTLRAVNYFTATSWFKNFHTLTRKKVESDFALMKSVGINCVSRVFPGVYDNNILVESSEHDMKIIATFWMPHNIDFIRDSREMQKHVEEIKNTISKLKDQKQIVAWQCSPDVFARIKDSYWEKDIQKQYNAYLNYMDEIVNTIHKTDPTRSIIVEIDTDKDIREKIKACKSILSESDLVGLSVDKSKSLSKIDFSAIDIPYIINNCEVEKLKNITCPHKGIVFIEWQDRQNRDFVTLNGLIDFNGNKKDKLIAVQEFVRHETITTDLNNVKILKPCKEVWNGMNLEYNAVLMRDGKWLLVREMNENITCEWYLMQTDIYGNPLTFKYLDSNPVLQLQIPAHPEMYKLLLLVKENGVVHTHTTLLNTPLVYSKKKIK